MVRFTIDRELVEKLLSTNEMVELCDESGRLIRRIPAELNRAEEGSLLEGWKQLTPDITPEEFQQLRDSDNWEGMTTPEVIDQLRNRS